MENNTWTADKDIKFLFDYLNNKVMNEDDPLVPYNIFLNLYNLLYSDVGTKIQNNDMKLFCNSLKKLISAQVITSDPEQRRVVSNIKQQYSFSLSDLSIQGNKLH